jgi:hypothetical protein
VLKINHRSTSLCGASLNLDSKVDFTKGTKVKINVWSPKVGAKILFKTEVSKEPKDGNGTTFVEVEATTTVANLASINL